MQLRLEPRGCGQCTGWTDLPLGCWCLHAARKPAQPCKRNGTTKMKLVAAIVAAKVVQVHLVVMVVVETAVVVGTLVVVVVVVVVAVVVVVVVVGREAVRSKRS